MVRKTEQQNFLQNKVSNTILGDLEGDLAPVFDNLLTELYLRQVQQVKCVGLIRRG
jgi:hypothetical protein